MSACCCWSRTWSCWGVSTCCWRICCICWGVITWGVIIATDTGTCGGDRAGVREHLLRRWAGAGRHEPTPSTEGPAALPRRLRSLCAELFCIGNSWKTAEWRNLLRFVCFYKELPAQSFPSPKTPPCHTEIQEPSIPCWWDLDPVRTGFEENWRKAQWRG